MNKKLILKLSIILLFVITILFIIKFGRHLICETWSLKQEGYTYYLTPSLHNYRLSKMSNDLIPKEVSTEIIKSPDQIMNLKAKATNITSIFWIILIIQIVLIIMLSIKVKKIKDEKGSNNE